MIATSTPMSNHKLVVSTDSAVETDIMSTREKTGGTTSSEENGVASSPESPPSQQQQQQQQKQQENPYKNQQQFNGINDPNHFYNKQQLIVGHGNNYNYGSSGGPPQQQPHSSSKQYSSSSSRSATSNNKIPPTTKDARKLFVGGLPTDITYGEFHAYFAEFGSIMDSVVMFDRESRRSRGFGFVTFHDAGVCALLLKHSGNYRPQSGKLEMRGKTIEIKVAQPRAATTSPTNSTPSSPTYSNSNNTHHHQQQYHHSLYASQNLHHPQQQQQPHYYSPNHGNQYTANAMHNPMSQQQPYYHGPMPTSVQYQQQVAAVMAEHHHQQQQGSEAAQRKQNQLLTDSNHSHATSNNNIQAPATPVSPATPMLTSSTPGPVTPSFGIKQQILPGFPYLSAGPLTPMSYHHPETPMTPAQAALDMAHHMMFYSQLLATPTPMMMGFEHQQYRIDQQQQQHGVPPVPPQTPTSVSNGYMTPSSNGNDFNGPTLTMSSLSSSANKKGPKSFSIGGASFFPEDDDIAEEPEKEEAATKADDVAEPAATTEAAVRS